MCLKFWKKENSQIKFAVEAFKGILEWNSIETEIEKYFDEDKTLVEVFVVGDLNRVDKDFRKKIEKDLMFEIKAKEFSVCYIMTIKENDLPDRITAVITESISEELNKLFDSQNQVVRIKR